MQNSDKVIMGLFEEMLKMGLASTGNLWIEIAVEQRNARLPIAIAHSRLLIYDRIDQKILSLEKIN